MLKAVKAFLNDDSGQGLVEYALIIALVAVALILVLIFLRDKIGDVFITAGQALENAPGNVPQPPSN